MQSAIDKLDADVQAVIRKQEELRDATEQAEIPAVVGPSTRNEEFSWDRVRVDLEVLHAIQNSDSHQYTQLSASIIKSSTTENAAVEVPSQLRDIVV